jgi:hypothetical protein
MHHFDGRSCIVSYLFKLSVSVGKQTTNGFGLKTIVHDLSQLVFVVHGGMFVNFTQLLTVC